MANLLKTAKDKALDGMNRATDFTKDVYNKTGDAIDQQTQNVKMSIKRKIESSINKTSEIMKENVK